MSSHKGEGNLASTLTTAPEDAHPDYALAATYNTSER